MPESESGSDKGAGRAGGAYSEARTSLFGGEIVLVFAHKLSVLLEKQVLATPLSLIHPVRPRAVDAKPRPAESNAVGTQAEMHTQAAESGQGLCLERLGVRGLCHRKIKRSYLAGKIGQPEAAAIL